MSQQVLHERETMRVLRRLGLFDLRVQDAILFDWDVTVKAVSAQNQPEGLLPVWSRTVSCSAAASHQYSGCIDVTVTH